MVKEKTKKPWYKKWWVYTLAFIVAFIILPFFINLAFKSTSSLDFLVAQWNAGDALTFYGTVVGAFVTVIALITTIVFTNEQNRKSELFQRNTIIADNKKVLLDEKYEKIINWISSIKEVVLLEVLKDENFWDKLFNKAINSFPEKLTECFKYMCAQDGLKDGLEKEFYKESIIIVNSIISGFTNLVEKIEKAENDIKIYKKQKEQFDQSFNKFEHRIKQVLNQNSNQNVENDTVFNVEEPKSEDEIFEDFISELTQNKEAYKDDYILLFNKYMEYKKNEKIQLIEELYRF